MVEKFIPGMSSLTTVKSVKFGISEYTTLVREKVYGYLALAAYSAISSLLPPLVSKSSAGPNGPLPSTLITSPTSPNSSRSCPYAHFIPTIPTSSPSVNSILRPWDHASLRSSATRALSSTTASPYPSSAAPYEQVVSLTGTQG